MKITKKKVVLFVSLLILIAAVLLLNYLFKVHNYQTTLTYMTFSEIHMENIPDGIYNGEYNVDFISAKVEVHVQDGKISDIRLLEHKNKRGASAEKIIDTIISEQKIPVDAVSGATNSSKVIMKAVENALIDQKG